MTVEDQTAFSPPEAFGGFRVLHQIGVGVLGPVFRTYEPTLDRLAAVKLFRLDITPEQSRALAVELQRLVDRPVNHLSVVPVLGAGVQGTLPYLATTYVAAESLDVALRHYAPAAIDTALPFVRQLAEGIDAAAVLGIRHGALHPRDIFVSPDQARASDFGIVQALEGLGLRAPVRRPYSAPERVAGQSWDVRADVFALAAIAYELLTGRRPAGHGEPTWAGLRELAPSIDADSVAAVFAMALAEDPRHRFKSACAFADALNLAATGTIRPAVLVASTPDAVGIADEPSAPEDEPDEPAVLPDAAAPSSDPDDPAGSLLLGFADEPDAQDLDDGLSSGTDDTAAILEEASAAGTETTPALEPDEPVAVEAQPLEETEPSIGVAQDDVSGADGLLVGALGKDEAVAVEDAKDQEATGREGESDREDAPDRHLDGSLEPAVEAPSVAPLWQMQPAPLDTTGTDVAGEPLFDPVVDAGRLPPASGPQAETSRLSGWPLAGTLILVLATGLAGGYWIGRDGVPAGPRPAGERRPASDTPTPVGAAGRAYSEIPAESDAATPAGREAGAARLAGPDVPSPGATSSQFGRLVVHTSPPGAVVTVNGRARGRTPLSLPNLPAGAYTVSVRLTGYSEQSANVSLSADAPVGRVAFELSAGGGQQVQPAARATPVRAAPGPSAPAPAAPGPSSPAPAAEPDAAAASGSLVIDSRPRGAQVFVDDVPVGVTPVTIDVVRPGPHRVRIVHAGFRDWVATTEVEPGKRARVAGSLEPVR